MDINIISISATSFTPLSASYVYDSGMELKSRYIKLNTGYSFIENTALVGTKDIKIGNDTLFYLTSSYTLKDVVNFETRNINDTDLIIFTGLKANNNRYLSNNNNVLLANSFTFGETELFTFEKNSDDTFKIYQGSKLLTVDRYAPWNITLEDELEHDTYQTQKFRIYYKNGNKITIETMHEASWWTETNTPPRYINRFLSYSSSKNVRAIGTTTDDDYNSNNNYTFELTFDIGVFTIGFDGNIKWIKYYNEDQDKSYNNTLEPNLSISGIKQNYLISSAYKTKTSATNTNAGSLQTDIMHLKNIMTPEYEYTLAPLVISGVPLTLVNTPENIKRREYERLYIGTNQDKGYDDIHLGFGANTKQMILNESNITYFHYPEYASVIALSSAGFIQDGAVAGHSPIKSDKIWKKMADYKKYSPWGNSQQWQRGTFLCAWLSGDEHNSVWQDRWYFPGCISIIDSLTGYITECNPATGSSFWDENSSMTMDPGVLYKYHHFGNNDSNNMSSVLTGDGTNLKLYFKNWNKITDDISPYNNNGIIDNYVSTSDYFNADNNECIVAYNSSYNPLNNITYSTWVRVNDWYNTKGRNIIDNNFRGGWGLRYENGFYNPIMMLLDTTYGHTMLFNNNGKILSDKILPLSGINFGEPIGVVIDNNLYSWVADNGSKKLYKIDYNGDILKEASINTYGELKDIVLDKNNNIWILADNNIIKYNTTYDTVCSSHSNIITPIVYFPFSNLKNQITNNISITSYNVEIENQTAYFDSEKDSYIQIDNGHTNEPALHRSYSYWIKPKDVNTSRAIYSSLWELSGIDSWDPAIRTMGNDPDNFYHWRGNASIDGTTHKLNVSRGVYYGSWEFYNLAANTTFQNDQWYHICETWNKNSQEAKLYVNSVLENTIPLSAYVPASNNYMQDNIIWIGRRKNPVLNNYVGNVDDFMVFDNILNQTQINSLYTNSYIMSSLNTTKLDIDIYNSLYMLNDTKDSCIDNNNNTWKIKNTDDCLYKGNELIFNNTPVDRVSCDKNNNIWILNDANKFVKLDNTGLVLLSGTITTNSNLSGRAIGFTNEYYDNQNQDYVWIIQSNDKILCKYDLNGTLISNIKITDNIDLSQYSSHNKGLMNFVTNGDFTKHNWDRKFSYVDNNKQPAIISNMVLGNNFAISSITLKCPVSALANNEWHHFTTTFDINSGTNLYVDSILTDTISSSGVPIYYKYENSLLIGAQAGKNIDIDAEIQLSNKYHFIGNVDDVRIYDFTLNNYDIDTIYMNFFEYQDLLWNMPIGEQFFIEQVEHMFKHKLPGMKSQFYNIKLIGLGISDTSIRASIEDIIKNTVEKISPAHTHLYKIIWE